MSPPTEADVHPTTEHEEIALLLPWFANRRLEPAERRRVADHLDGCGDCRRQLDTLGAMHREVRSAGAAEPGPSRDLLAETMARIEAEAPREKPVPFWLAWWQATPAPAQWALAAQLLLLIGLAAALWLPAGRGPVVTAGSGPGVASSAAGPRLQVGFTPTAPESAIRQAMLAVDGEIVAGPSALGLYTVELAAEPGDGQAVTAALARLRGLDGVVDYAEPLAGPGEPGEPGEAETRP